MIPLENQVSNLDLSKRLKELGVKQESLFLWWESRIDNKWNVVWSEIKHADAMIHKDEPHCYSAFTVAEFGEMLPMAVDGGLIETGKRTVDDTFGWYVAYVNCESSSHSLIQGYRDTEADARAKMLIYLLEHGLINP